MHSFKASIAPVGCLSLALVATLCASGTEALGGAPAQDSPRSRAVREVFVPEPSGTRSEYFRLDLAPEQDPEESTGDFEGVAATPAPAGEPFGLVRWVGGRNGEDSKGWRNEQEIYLFEQKTQISLVESLSHTERVLSYREIRARTGRRQHLTWTPDGLAKSSDSDGRTGYRREFDLSSGAALPLALLELARRDQLTPGTYSVFAPRANEFEPLEIRVVRTGDRRLYRLLFRDGTRAGTYEFRGRELLSFRWQSGGSVATPITEEEFLSRKKRFADRPRPSEEWIEAGIYNPDPRAIRAGERERRD